MALQLLKDGKTFADINSEEPKICFLHGWGGSSSDFSLITNNFESIAIDLPGFGKSKEPESSMNPKEYAEYIINLIPDTVEVLVGHSFGGKVAVHMSFMKNYKNLVLIGSPLIRKTPEETMNLRLNLYKFLNSLNLISDKSLEKYNATCPYIKNEDTIKSISYDNKLNHINRSRDEFCCYGLIG